MMHLCNGYSSQGILSNALQISGYALVRELQTRPAAVSKV